MAVAVAAVELVVVVRCRMLPGEAGSMTTGAGAEAEGQGGGSEGGKGGGEGWVDSVHRPCTPSPTQAW